MALDRKDVKKIAHLARLQISEAEVAASTESLARILGLIEQMNAVDTKAVAPMAHPQDAALRLRDDRVTEPDLAAWLARQQQRSAGATTISGPELGHLGHLLRERNIAACELFARIEPALAPLVGAEVAQQLRSAMRVLDFERAAVLLATHLASHGQPQATPLGVPS